MPGTVPEDLDVLTYLFPTTTWRKLGHRAVQQRAQGHAMEVGGGLSIGDSIRGMGRVLVPFFLLSAALHTSLKGTLRVLKFSPIWGQGTKRQRELL